MKEFIYPEMMVHVPFCTHKKPQNVLIISNNSDQFLSETARYRDVDISVIPSQIDALRDVADGHFDIVLLEESLESAFLAHVNRVLKADGLLSMQHPALDDLDANTALMQILGNYFKIIMPYHLEDGSTLLLSSKEYHPTADIILQRSDLLEGQRYYNCDIHTAAFAMPNYIRKNYLGIIRN